MPSPTRDEFAEHVRAHRAEAGSRTLAVPVSLRLLSDQLTPVLAYRRLVAPDERTAPSFLLESVENQPGSGRSALGQGRYSILGARPAVEVLAAGDRVTVTDHRGGPAPVEGTIEPRTDPFEPMRRFNRGLLTAVPEASVHRGMLPDCATAGWVGYAGYDTVRDAEPEKLDPARAPADDRGLPDLAFGLYRSVVVFDHARRVAHLVHTALVGPDDDPGAAWDDACGALNTLAAQIQTHARALPSGEVPPVDAAPALDAHDSNMTLWQYDAMIDRALEYIRAGDVFQVVLGQRFERRSPADPFDVYRALRSINPSPYMAYMQTPGCILVASSPEILCRVERDDAGDLIVTNRPLAGTRPRGRTPEEDRSLERELLADPKERAEHTMLVDLGRNDVGVVARPGSVRLPDVMAVERYSHVMHISSTVTGALRAGLDCWDALRAALPVGTISGAPKIRAMQVIDELEPVRRGPYGGGLGWVGLDGQMDIALALRTMVVPTGLRRPGGDWTYHIQAAGGIVADSRHEDEYRETVNKAAAMARAVGLAERVFAGDGPIDRPEA